MRLRIFNKLFKRNFSTSTSGVVNEKYARSLRWVHWLMALGFCGCTLSGYNSSKIDYNTATKEKKEMKMTLIWLHKSFGVLMLILMPCRLFLRMTTKIPAHVPGRVLEVFAGNLSHKLFYGAIILMPPTGILMSYTAGYGIPFFKWKFMDGAPKHVTDKPSIQKISQALYFVHVNTGKMLEFLIPIHIGAIAYYRYVKGLKLLPRMNPLKR
jgi:cytochrome b561